MRGSEIVEVISLVQGVGDKIGGWTSTWTSLLDNFERRGQDHDFSGV